jgi:hypothetical protein
MVFNIHIHIHIRTQQSNQPSYSTNKSKTTNENNEKSRMHQIPLKCRPAHCIHVQTENDHQHFQSSNQIEHRTSNIEHEQ